MFLFFTALVPPGSDYLGHCQPHDVERGCWVLGIPIRLASCRRRPCSHDDRWHLFGGEHGNAYYIDGKKEDHFAPALDDEHNPILNEHGEAVLTQVLSPHEQKMHVQHVCHNHLWFEVPDDYEIPPTLQLKLKKMMVANEFPFQKIHTRKYPKKI